MAALRIAWLSVESLDLLIPLEKQLTQRFSPPLNKQNRHASIIKLLLDPEWSQWSDRELGRMTGVDGKTVASVRKQYFAETAITERIRVDKHGGISKIDTSNLGKRIGGLNNA
jgi:hypothetical protein